MKTRELRSDWRGMGADNYGQLKIADAQAAGNAACAPAIFIQSEQLYSYSAIS